MDAKLTLLLNEDVIKKAKKFAAGKGLSLSKLTEIMFQKATEKKYASIEDMPIADWVMELAEGTPEYRTKPRTRKELKEEYYNSKKR